MLDEIEDAGVRTVGHVPNGTCHGHVCDDQIPVNPADREGSEDKLSVVARESERFTGGKEKGNQPQPSSQARLHLAKRVLNHPPSPRPHACMVGQPYWTARSTIAKWGQLSLVASSLLSSLASRWAIVRGRKQRASPSVCESRTVGEPTLNRLAAGSGVVRHKAHLVSLPYLPWLRMDPAGRRRLRNRALVGWAILAGVFLVLSIPNGPPPSTEFFLLWLASMVGALALAGLPLAYAFAFAREWLRSRRQRLRQRRQAVRPASAVPFRY